MQDKYSLSLKENLFLAKKMLVESIYTNARIERCNVTFPQTQTILDGVNVAEVKLDDIQCILNLRDAWKFTLKNIEVNFDLDFISSVNGYVARNESLEWGVLRTGRVGISGTKYVPDIPIKDDVIKKIEQINLIKNITERAIKFMLYGMRGQLFWDGNKRTSIICANKILVSNGKGILLIKEENLNEFNEKLTNYYNTNNSEQIEQFLYNKCIYGID